MEKTQTIKFSLPTLRASLLSFPDLTSDLLFCLSSQIIRSYPSSHPIEGLTPTFYVEFDQKIDPQKVFPFIKYPFLSFPPFPSPSLRFPFLVLIPLEGSMLPGGRSSRAQSRPQWRRAESEASCL